MAENIIISFEANTSQLTSTIDQLKSLGQVSEQDSAKFKQLGAASAKAATEAKTPLTQLNQQLKETGANVVKAFGTDIINNITKTTQQFTSLRQQIKEATNEAVQFSRQFGELSPQAVQARARVAELKKELGDTQKGIAALDPEAKFTAISQLARGVAGGFVAAQGALALFGNKSKDVEEAILKVQGALAFSQGLNELLALGDAFKNLQAVLGVTEAATTATAVAQTGLTAATVTETAATEGATVATKSFTAALLTNPITIVVAAVAALAGAYLLLSKETESAADAQERYNKLFQDREKKLGAAASQVTEKYIQELNFRSESERQFAITTAKTSEDLEKKLAAIDINRAKSVVGFVNAQRKLGFELSTELKSQYDSAIKLLDDSTVKELKSREDKAKKLTDAETKHNEERARALEELNKKFAAITEKGIQDEFEKRTAAAANDFGDNVKFLENSLKEKLITQKEFNAAFKAFEVAFQNEVTQIQKDGAESRNREAIKQAKDADAQNAKIDKEELDLSLARIDNATQDKIAKLKEEFAKKKTATRQEQEALSNETKIIELKAEIQKQTLIRDAAITGEKEKIAAITAIRKAQGELAGIQSPTVDNDPFSEANLKKELESLDKWASQVSDIYRGVFESRISQLEEEKNAVLAKDDDEIASLKKKFDEGHLGRKKYEAQLKAIEDKKAADQKRIDAEIAAQKKKQAEINKALAIFNATIHLAEAIVAATTAGPGIGLALAVVTAALDAAQLAVIASTPIPKFHSGRLAKTDSNEEHAIVRKDETIFDPQQSKEYAPTFKAIYHRQIKPSVINDYVNFKLKNFSNNQNSTIDTNKLAHDIAWALRDHKAIEIKNMAELGAEIAKHIPQPDPRKW